MIKYLLDTNICIYIIKKSPGTVFNELKKHKIGDVGISAITYCELQYGVSNSRNTQKNQDALNEFLAPLEILDFPNAAAGLFDASLKSISRNHILRHDSSNNTTYRVSSRALGTFETGIMVR